MAAADATLSNVLVPERFLSPGAQMNRNDARQLGSPYRNRNTMTYTPPIPAANQAPYPTTASNGPADTDKAALVAQMKSNGERQQASGSALPVALLFGAAAAGAIGYILWTDRAGTAKRN